MLEENPEAADTLVYEVEPGDIEDSGNVYVPQGLRRIFTRAQGHHTRDTSSCRLGAKVNTHAHMGNNGMAIMMAWIMVYKLTHVSLIDNLVFQ